MFKKLDHIGVGTADFQRFIKFYTEILGFKVRERWKVKPGTGSTQVDELANLVLEDGAVIELFGFNAEGPDPEYKGPPFEAGF